MDNPPVNFTLPSIYPITDTAISGLPVVVQVERMIMGGAQMIQIREKKASSREFYDAAAAAIETAGSSGARIIINDRVDIAMMLRAAGVHLGQDDLSPFHARRLLGNNAIIGLSTHTLAQVRKAVEAPINYVAFGPVFTTLTKENPDPAVGLETLAKAKRIVVDMPLAAIGGITSRNVGSVFEAGADSAAMIGEILSDPDRIAKKLGELFRILP